MLTEKRFEEILKILEKKRTITVQELKDRLNTSESTIRRDLTTLHNEGKLIKVFGGAVSLDSHYRGKDTSVVDRTEINREEKLRIARHAASLIRPGDFVFLDAGTTTGCMIEFLAGQQIVFVTNGVTHAQKLAAVGLRVILLGGEMKVSTDAVVGSDALLHLQKYHFTIGFFGTNGVSPESGFSTPDSQEAAVKEVAMKQTRRPYVLCAHDKFGQVSPVSFAALSSATIITDKVEHEAFKELENLIVVEA